MKDTNNAKLAFRCWTADSFDGKLLTVARFLVTIVDLGNSRASLSVDVINYLCSLCVLTSNLLMSLLCHFHDRSLPQMAA